MTSTRRDFLKSTAAVSLSAAIPLAASAPGILAAGILAPGTRFVGIQIAPPTMLDEGIERCLDFLQETAGVNVLLPYSHAYAGGLNKPLHTLGEHFGPPKDLANRKLPLLWVKHRDQARWKTPLRHQQVDASFEYANRDLFAELTEPARKRGMKVYARVLDGGGQRTLPGYESVLTRDVYGKPGATACWNHPDYKEFWAASAADLFRNYRLDGFQWGAERQGPLMNVILPWNDAAPTCFCEHCRARGKAAGVDAERARIGFEQLFVYVRGLMAGKPKPPEGAFGGFLRLLIRYPEILAWEYQYRLGREDMQRGIYQAVKSVKPDAQVGWHVDHQPSSWDMVYRAEMSYAEMAPYSDFIKFIAYHDVLAPRIRSWYLARLEKTVLGDLSLKESLDLYYELFGYDKNVEPKLEELNNRGMSPDYVYRETKRSVASAEGKTKIYTGVGFDVPWGQGTYSPEADKAAEKVYEAVMKSFEAGASGIVVSREYEEMRASNLRAVGRAVRALG